MSQPNSATTLQQQLQLQAVSAASSESLMSNAFDLICGANSAQQFLNHMDLYQQQRQQHQLNYHRQQLSQTPSQAKSSIGSSSSTSSSPNSSICNGGNNQNNNNYHSTVTSQQQQHLVKHSISLSTSPIASPTKALLNQVTSSALSNNNNNNNNNHNINNNNNIATSTAANAATATATLLNNLKSQQHFNLHSQLHQQLHNNQMEAQQQQQQQQQTVVTVQSSPSMVVGGGSNGNNSNIVGLAATIAPNAIVTNAVSSSSNAITSIAAATTQQQQQQQQQQQHTHTHQQHQHQHPHASNASPYKSSPSCWCFGDSTYHMKILVPAVASGAIIGKGGETIASLQKDSGARVKMSKSHDFYPGTTERVCLITGSIDGIMSVVDFIMDKIREKPDLTTKIIDTESKQTQERDKQVKILVPNSTAGMIIGKGGAFIKQIKEESGSYVQISQKPKDISLQERCITIIGDKENNKNACKMILSKIVEDPQSGTCLNVSYADVNGPVANFNPTGSPYATNQNAINSSSASLNSTLGTTIGGTASAPGLLVNGTGINLSLNLGTPNPAPNLALATQLLEHIKVALRGSGYSETATNEVCAALGVLAKYGVLGMGVGVPHSNGAHATLGSYLGITALDHQAAAAATAPTATAGNVFGAVGQVNLEQYTAAAAAAAAAAVANRPSQSHLEAAAAQFDPFRHLSSAAAATQATTPVSLNNNSFGLTAATGASGATTAQTLGAASAAHPLSGLSKSPTPGDLGAKDTKNVEIPEVIVGAILGPNGRSLVEIQHVSGANVQISKKGIFAPGTRNRIVTITGQPNAIAKAQYLIEQKINEEESKRARQIPLTTVVN